MVYMVLAVSLMIYGGVNYYIGRRLYQWLSFLAPVSRLVYWAVFWPLALAFPAGRMLSEALPLPVLQAMSWVGGYFMAAYVYVLPLLVLIDVLRGLNYWLGLVSRRQGERLARWAGGALLLLFAGLMLYGTWRARTPVVTEYDLSIPKQAWGLEQLHVVLVSDTHLGAVNGVGRIRELVDIVNGLEPDVILLAGDIVDDDLRFFQARDMASELRQLRPRLGTYAVPGNHDPTAEGLAEFRAELERAGIRLLVDEWVKVDDRFYLVGRSDRRRGGNAPALGEILAGTDPRLPILLMDHRPDRLEDAAAAGVDLQVSGHTHRGQVWPGSLITADMYEVDWGHLQKGGTHVVVSLGYGTWGPPVRIGNRPEVVSIRLSFGE